MKFGNFMQNTGIVRITVMWSKSKPEEEFQYGGRLFLQNGNSYTSVTNWVILTIFGMLIDIALLKKMRYGSKIAPQRPPSWKSIRRRMIVSPPRIIQYWWNAACWRRMTWQLQRWGQNRNWKRWRTENEKLLIGRAGNKSGILQCRLTSVPFHRSCTTA